MNEERPVNMTFGFVSSLALSVAATAGLSAAVATAHARPNILLIIADDMGLDASRCYTVGDKQAPMPNIERLCEQGLVFDNAYSAPVCSPTRASIMTGQYGFRTGVGGAIPKSGGTGLSSEIVSLFDVMSETDYSATLIGKWHLASSGRDYEHPDSLGVKDYFGLLAGGTPNYFNWNAVQNGNSVEVDGYTSSVFTDRAIDWIGEQQSSWFLWLAYNAPHTPFHLPPQELHSFDDLPDDANAIEENPVPYYNAALEAMDTEIGRLLDSLSEETRSNTLIMFVGDNGTPGRVASELYQSRGAKGTVFEGGTHVPFIISGPDVANGRTEALVNTTDFHATIAALAGAPVDRSDAFDFSAVLQGNSGQREHVYVEHFSDQPSRGPDRFGWAIRDNTHKLVALDGQDPMLFDLTIDPFEATDLLAASASQAAQTKATELQEVYLELRE